MERKSYETDLSDYEWKKINPFFPKEKGGGRPRKHDPQEIMNAIYYLLRAGCAWRLLPHDLPPWQTVYGYFLILVALGIWEEMNNYMRNEYRKGIGKEESPSIGIMDSQSVKSIGLSIQKVSMVSND